MSDKKIAIAMSLDLHKFSMIEESRRNGIKKFLKKSLNDSLKVFVINKEIKINSTGDGYFILICGNNIPYFIDFIINLELILRSMIKEFNQGYRIGADIGIIKFLNNDKQNINQKDKEHFSECAIVSSRLEEGGKVVMEKYNRKYSILLSENLFNLFKKNNEYENLFFIEENIKTKDRTLSAYRIIPKRINNEDEKKLIKDFLLNRISIDNNKRYSLVIIDDEVQMLNMVGTFLKRTTNYNIETFSNPITGLNYVLSNKVGLVLLDIMMPQMDGIEVLERIKSEKENVAVIMMTAYSTMDRVLQTHKRGADSYLMKPFESLSILNNKIREVLISQGILERMNKKQEKTNFLQENQEYTSKIHQAMSIINENGKLSKNFNSFIQHNAYNLINNFVSNEYLLGNKEALINLSLEIEKLKKIKNKPFSKYKSLYKYINLKIEDIVKKQNIKLEHNIDILQDIKINNEKINFLILIIDELLENALEALKRKRSQPIVKIFIDNLVTEDLLLIKVASNSTRIQSDKKEKIFEKNFSTKKDGSGLGLYLISNIITLYHGEFSYNYENKFNTFNIKIPI